MLHCPLLQLFGLPYMDSFNSLKIANSGVVRDHIAYKPASCLFHALSKQMINRYISVHEPCILAYQVEI